MPFRFRHRIRLAPGAQLTWTYVFAPWSRRTRIPLSAFLATQLSGYMTAALTNLKNGAEPTTSEIK
jgi:hypothetical protein